MAQQQIITKPYVGELQDNDSLFINHDGALRQIKKSDADFAQGADMRAEVAAREAFETSVGERIAEFDSNAAALQTEVDRLRGECDTLAAENRKQENRIDALIKLNKGQTYDILSEEGESTSRTAPSGAKYVSVDKVGGKSVVFEQRIKPEYISASKTENGIAFVNNGDGTVTVSGTATANTSIAVGSNVNTGSLKNKPFILTGCPKGGSSDTYFIGVSDAQDYFKWDKGYGYYRPNGYGYGYTLSIYIMSGTTIDTPITFKPNLFVINTSVFLSLDVFKKMFPNDYYPYCEPTIISSQTDMVDVASADSTVTQQITTGFPALNSAGSVYDYIDLNEGKLHQRVGVVDLGSLDYYVADSRFNTKVPFTGTGSSGLNIITQKYVTSGLAISRELDKSICANLDGYLFIYDTSYTDVTTFKQSLSGQIAYYELAEEVITDIEIPTELTDWLEVEAGGSLTFHNADESKQLPVPNGVSWVRKLNEVE